MKKRVYIETLGCQMNKSDTERIFGILSHFGYEQTNEAKSANLLIMNTCSIRQLSADKAYSRMGLWGKWKKTRPDLKIAMCGCVAQQDKQSIRKRAPYVDLVFGTHNIYELPNLIKRIENDERIVSVPEKAYKADELEYEIHRAKGVGAWVTITEGCNNFCTYCIVPYTRGRERSRAPEVILQETKNALEQGYKEITLLGQNVDSYGKDFKDKNITLASLLKSINALEYDFRIRFVTSYPTDITEELITTVKECDKVCEYFHIPMQAGDDDILKAMNRRYNVEQYTEIVQKIRKTFPDVTITSDFIAGFPGETEEQFQNTLSVIRKLEFDYSNTAAYSPREKTVAAKWVDKYIDEDTKVERLKRLNDINKEVCLKSNKKCVGRTYEVLIETSQLHKEKQILTGRTRGNKLVHIEGTEELVGKKVTVEITGAKTWYLNGKLI